MKSNLTVQMIKSIGEIALERLTDFLYDEDIDLIQQTALLVEEELEKMDTDWSAQDVDVILNDIDIHELNEHRQEVLSLNRLGIEYSLGISQMDFI